ncbi:MAG: hypothetical protein KJ880_02740 [Candidatus Omnitrophica bacterium]|nr:hypothetical protein [Candidatus Omnitrophota bacterium]MBU1870051.1 hypothetical protein [Candidatus Omnitrophota bacterium]
MRKAGYYLFLSVCLILLASMAYSDDQGDKSFLSPDRIYGVDKPNAPPSFGASSGTGAFLTPDRVYGVDKQRALSYEAGNLRFKTKPTTDAAKPKIPRKSGCQYDSDCSGGKVCVKTRFSSDGICASRDEKQSYIDGSYKKKKKAKEDIHNKTWQDFDY